MRVRDRNGRFCRAPRQGYRDYTGTKFGRLIVDRMAGYQTPKGGTSQRIWKCRCTCGGVIYVPSFVLTSGNTRSCGCLKIDIATAKFRAMATHGATRHINGKQTLTPTYISWMSMKQRCLYNSPLNKSWKDYGGANPPVRICKRWVGPHGFETFLHDMGERPAGTTLGRYLDSGNYKSSNCSWQTRPQQQEERRRKRGH